MALPLFEQMRPGKAPFRAVFFDDALIWLFPNDLALFQAREALEAAGGAFAENFQPRLMTFGGLETLLGRELGPPEVPPLTRRFILNGLAEELAEALELPLARLSPKMLGELADSLGDGLDRLKLADIGWDKAASLKPRRLARVLAALGRRHDESLLKINRCDPFSKRRLILKLLAEKFPFRALAGLRKIECRWSQRFSPFETDLLTALSRLCEVEVVFNIPAWARNEDLAHGSGFDIVRTFREMERHTDSNKLFLSFSEARESSAPAPLAYAAETLLAPREYRLAAPPDPEGAVAISRAPTAYQEVEAAARIMKELAARGLSRPHDLALVAPDLNVYGPLIRDVGRRFGLAFHFRRGEKLIELGPARALMDLLALWSSHWERSRVLGVLASPYFTPASKRAAELHRVSLKGGVTDRRAGGGFENNLRKIALSEKDGELAAEILARVENLKAHGARLAAHKNWPDFLAEFRRILDALGWPGPLEEAPETPVNAAGADLAAAFMAREEIGRLEEALRGPYAPETSLAAFRLWLGRTLEERAVQYDKNPEGRVWALNYYDIHGGLFDEIFFLGLNERIFPQTSAKSRWWPEEFIRATQGAAFLGRPLWSDAEAGYRQEELMLATGLGQARRRVHLYYHQTGGDGRAALPSPLLGQLKELWPEGALREIEISPALPPPPPLVRGEDELWANLMNIPPESWPKELQAREDLHQKWRKIRRRREAWRGMKKFAAPGGEAARAWVEGLESHRGRPLLRGEFFKSLAECPLAFWWGQTLGLAGGDEPVEEWPKSREGTLLHNVLEKFFRRGLPRDGRPGAAWPGAFDFEECRAILLDILAEEIKKAGRGSPLGREPLWEARVKKLPSLLSSWLAREFSRPSARPWKMEWSFGGGEDMDAPPYELALADGGSIYFKGRVDRLDDAEEGLIVRDYKTRESAAFKAKLDKNGEPLELPPSAYPLAIYTLAASAHFGRAARSFYEFIKAAPESAGQALLVEAGAEILSEAPPDDAEKFTLPERLRSLWGQVLSGVYEPLGEGCDWCAFSSLCPRLDKNEGEAEA